MPKRDDFSDIPELGPAKDDRDGTDLTLSLSAADKPAKSGTPQPKASSNGTLVLLLILAAALGGFGFWSFQQLKALDSQLANAKLRVTNLESLISTTDNNVSKSGAALQVQIRQLSDDKQARAKHIDTEIGKLWAIYQRYKPQLADHDAQLKKQEKLIASQEERVTNTSAAMGQQVQKAAQIEAALDQTEQMASGLRKSLEKIQKSFQAELNNLDSVKQQMDDLQNQQMDEMQEQLSSLRKQPAIPSKVSDLLNQHEQAIEAIDGSRRQMTQELLTLHKQLNNVQLELENRAPLQ